MDNHKIIEKNNVLRTLILDNYMQLLIHSKLKPFFVKFYIVSYC